MKTPRRSLSLVLCILLALSSSASSKKPTDVAEQFLVSVRDGDTGTVTKLVHPELLAFGSEIAHSLRERLPAGTPISVRLIEETGSAARVSATVELTPESVLTIKPSIPDSYISYRSTFEAVLTPSAYTELFEHSYVHGFFELSEVVSGRTFRASEGEPLRTYADNGLDKATLERWLSDTPLFPRDVISELERIAAELKEVRERGDTINLDDYRTRIRKEMAATGEYLVYAHFSISNRIYVIGTPARFITFVPLELHKVDGKWLVAN
jgi:hypothetical protein